MTGSSDTDVVFSEVDLNHNVAPLNVFFLSLKHSACSRSRAV